MNHHPFRRLTTAVLLGLGLAPAYAADYQPAEDSTPGSIVLEGTIRDFKMTHPDFETYPGTYNKVAPQLDPATGVPVLDVKYYKAKRGTSEQSVYSASSFAQWFTDVEGVNLNIPYSITLERDSSRPGVYWFAREKQMAAPYNYFFPIDRQGFGLTQKPKNKPYKYYGGGDIANHNYHFTYTIDTLFTYTAPSKRDLDGDGVFGETFRDESDPGDAMFFKFTGDDDVWVFINNNLAVDLGGVHSQKSASVNVDDYADELGLKVGHTYSLKLFFAERCTTESNFRIETSMLLSTETSPLYD